MQYLPVFAAALVAYVALDAVWLVFVANAFFKSQLGSLVRSQPDLIAAAIFYLIYTGGLVILVVAPALHNRSSKAAAWRGAVLGLTAYATFDLSNLAIIQGWTLAVTLVDIGWGTIVSTFAALTGYQIGRLASVGRKEQAQ